MKDINEWHKIGNKLTSYLGICSCQRKLKSIVEILIHINIKISNHDWNALTMNELLITALLEKRGLITHGTNCEYPFIGNEEFWNWLSEIKDNEYLEDN
jgi:hypothetical protein